MASKLAVHDNGYEDERFEQVISQTLHCIICTNVIKDPVMCRENEHLFCRACITEHLRNYQRCPSCMEALTVDTLRQASRTVTNLLAELTIRCEFFSRGCIKLIELGNLETHERECGFAPAVCSNEGCQLEVNKQDLLHHETAVCELRRVKCHSCNDIRQEVDIVKVNLAAINVKLGKIEEKMDKNEKKSSEKWRKNQENVKTVVENVVTKVELLQEQLNNQEVNNRHDIVQMKKSLNEITKLLEKMTQQTSHEVQAEQEQMKKGIAEAAGMGREPKIVIAGGTNRTQNCNSVEMFSLSNGTWTLLHPMRKNHVGASSVVHNNQFVVVGGDVKSMEKLSLKAIQVDKSITWENVPIAFLGDLTGHCSVVYNGRLIVIGGYDADKDAYSDCITEVCLVSPYTSQVLTTMRQRKCYHGVVLFGNVMVIVGGRENFGAKSALRTVVIYDITTNGLKELTPLPYPVFEMATVRWGNDNVIIMGGADSNREPLNTVLMYNVKTQKSHMLPDMKYKRKGCVAAVVRDTVIVMGGKDPRGSPYKSVENFRFDRYTWEELPEMHEARWLATAAVC